MTLFLFHGLFRGAFATQSLVYLYFFSIMNN